MERDPYAIVFDRRILKAMKGKLPPLEPTPGWPFRLSEKDRDYLRMERIKVDA